MNFIDYWTNMTESEVLEKDSVWKSKPGYTIKTFLAKLNAIPNKNIKVMSYDGRDLYSMHANRQDAVLLFSKYNDGECFNVENLEKFLTSFENDAKIISKDGTSLKQMKLSDDALYLLFDKADIDKGVDVPYYDDPDDEDSAYWDMANFKKK